MWYLLSVSVYAPQPGSSEYLQSILFYDQLQIICKAPGPFGIIAEILKVAGDEGIRLPVC